MYQNINRLTNEVQDFVTYDFKNEAPWKEVRAEKDPIKKFQLYRNKNKICGQKFDCDNSNGTCSLANSIYEKLWNWSFEKRYELPEALKKNLGNQWNRIGCDTMNSFATTYIQALKIYSLNSTAVNDNKLITQFASLTHSIGNFTLVPFKLNPQDKKSFNQYRGFNLGKYFTYDYFDLSLKLLKENVSDTLFRNYIDTFFLSDYVDGDYNVIALFKRHEEFLKHKNLPLGEPKEFLPVDESELNEYLSNVIEKIISRGKRMTVELYYKLAH